MSVNLYIVTETLSGVCLRSFRNRFTMVFGFLTTLSTQTVEFLSSFYTNLLQIIVTFETVVIMDFIVRSTLYIVTCTTSLIPLKVRLLTFTVTLRKVTDTILQSPSPYSIFNSEFIFYKS